MVARATARKTVEAPRRQPVETQIPDFDRIIHEKTRLAIVSALAVNQTLTLPSVVFRIAFSSLNVSD